MDQNGAVCGNELKLSIIKSKKQYLRCNEYKYQTTVISNELTVCSPITESWKSSCLLKNNESVKIVNVKNFIKVH